MLLENLTYLDVEAYLEKEDSILIPVGSVEQHSPYGLIGTDFIAAEGVAREVGKKMDLLVAPTITYGVSPHHMAFKGTITLRPQTLTNIITDVAESLLQHGFRRLFFINGHGGNTNAVHIALQDLKMRGTVGQFVLINGYECLKDTKILQELFDGQEGSHATPSEVSLTRLLRPESFETVATEPQNVVVPEYYWPLTAEEMRKVFPDGRIGSAPWLASKEKGRVLMDFAAEGIAQQITDAKSIAILE